MKLNLLDKLKEIWQKLVSKLIQFVPDFTFFKNVGDVSDLPESVDENSKPIKKRKTTRKRRTNGRNNKRNIQRDKG